MESSFREADADEFRARHAASGEALALRVYTSRLIGADPELVLHVKGSGCDLAWIDER